MRIYRNLIILVVVMVVLIGAYVVVDRLKGPEGTGFEEIEVIKLDKEKVEELTVENSDGKFVFKKNDTEWEYITTGKKYDIDKTRLDSIASNICDLYANKVVEENAKDLSKYGLDTPVTITAKTSDEQVAQIEVGDLTPTQQGYYIKKKDEKTVYTVAYYTGLMLNASKSDLRNKYIFDVTSADVTALAVTRNGKMSFRAVKSEETGWSVAEPIETGINMVRLNTALESVVRATIENFIEEDVQDLSKYGLENPSYVIEAAAGDLRVTFMMGDEKEKNKETYAIIKGTNEVFTLNPDTLNFIDMPTIEILDGFVYSPYIYDVTDAEVKIDDKTIKLKIEGNTEDKTKEKFYIDGRDVTEKGEEGKAEFRAYYRSLIGIPVSEVDPEATPQGDPEISVTYQLNKAPGEVKIELIPRDADSYYAMKNGEYTGMVVRKQYLDEEEGPRKAYDKLIGLLD